MPTFLEGKDYPNVCPACRQAVDHALEVISVVGEDTVDEEAPMMFASDNHMLCSKDMAGTSCQLTESDICDHCGEALIDCPSCKEQTKFYCKCPLPWEEQAEPSAA